MINNFKKHPSVDGTPWDKLAPGYLNVVFQLTFNTAIEGDLGQHVGGAEQGKPWMGCWARLALMSWQQMTLWFVLSQSTCVTFLQLP